MRPDSSYAPETVTCSSEAEGLACMTLDNHDRWTATTIKQIPTSIPTTKQLTAMPIIVPSGREPELLPGSSWATSKINEKRHAQSF